MSHGLLVWTVFCYRTMELFDVWLTHDLLPAYLQLASVFFPVTPITSYTNFRASSAGAQNFNEGNNQHAFYWTVRLSETNTRYGWNAWEGISWHGRSNIASSCDTSVELRYRKKKFARFHNWHPEKGSWIMYHIVFGLYLQRSALASGNTILPEYVLLSQNLQWHEW